MTQRRGMSLLEVTVTGLLLGALLLVCLQLLGATAARRRATADREIASVEAANVMERLAVRPWEELSADALDEVQLSREALEALHQGRLDIEITPAEGQLDAKRVVVLVDWADRAGKPQRPVRLVAWRFRTDGPEE